MGLTTGGTYLDINTIVSGLMSVEQAPLTVITTKQTAVKAQISAYGTVTSALTAFQTAVSGLSTLSNFQKLTATSSDPAVTVTAGSTAAPGSYSIEVSQLAQAQKLATAGQVSAQDPIGSGTITFDFGTITGGTKGADGKYTNASFDSSGTGTKTVTIDPANTSLSGIRDAINNAKVGVTATIVNDGGSSPYRLVLTDVASGKAGSMKISTTGDQALGNLLNNDPSSNTSQALTETKTAQDALFTIDGLSVSKPSNVITDAIDGVTLNLSKVSSTGPASVDVAMDNTSMAASVTQFVTAYNAINKTLKDLTAYNADTKVAATLNGDATIRSIQSQLRAVMSSPVANGNTLYSTLAQVGVSLQADSTLAVNSTKLNAALTADPKAVASLFATSGTPSNSLVSYASATSATVAGTYAVVTTKAASQGTLSGSAASGLTVTAGSNDSLSFTVNGIAADITLKPGTYTADSLAKEIQGQINGSTALTSAGVSVVASTNNGVLTLTSKSFGASSAVQISGGADPSYYFGSPTQSQGNDVEGTINGVVAKGTGQTLTGAVGDTSEGLRISVKGAAGDQGTVNYSKGYASQFNDLLTKLLSDSGSITARTTGLNSSLTSLTKDSDALNVRLAKLQTQYETQYSTLDTLLGTMKTTSTYLTQQLASIAANS